MVSAWPYAWSLIKSIRLNQTHVRLYRKVSRKSKMFSLLDKQNMKEKEMRLQVKMLDRSTKPVLVSSVSS